MRSILLLPLLFASISLFILIFLSRSSYSFREVCYNNPLFRSKHRLNCDHESQPSKLEVQPKLTSEPSATLHEHTGTMASAAARQFAFLKPAEKCTGVVIFLHGLGDTGHGWCESFKDIRKDKHIRYVFPHASMMPVTLNFGMQMPSWFDIESLDMKGKEDEKGIAKASKELQDMIKKEQLENDLPSDRIVIGGFSMGGSLALYTALKHGEKLGGVIGLSTWLPLRDQFLGKNTASKFASPVFQGHGNADPMVQESFGKITHEFIKTKTESNAEYNTYDGMGHSSCGQEMEDVRKFIEKVLPPLK